MNKQTLALLHEDLINNKDNYTNLGKKYGISRATVRYYAKKFKLHNGALCRVKKHTLDVSYFDSIDNSNKAYVLGFIYADGCNIKKGLAIGINHIDVEVLKFIKNELKASDDLRFIPAFKPTWSDKYELRITSVQLSNKLTNVGCPPAKSNIITFPKFINDENMSHFIRGYFDGDGCLYSQKNNKGWHLGFTCGSQSFIKDLQKYIENKTKSIGKIYNTNKAYCLMYSKKTEILNLLNYMYKNSCFSMSRKREKFENFINNF